MSLDPTLPEMLAALDKRQAKENARAAAYRAAELAEAEAAATAKARMDATRDEWRAREAELRAQEDALPLAELKAKLDELQSELRLRTNAVIAAQEAVRKTGAEVQRTLAAVGRRSGRRPLDARSSQERERVARMYGVDVNETVAFGRGVFDIAAELGLSHAEAYEVLRATRSRSAAREWVYERRSRREPVLPMPSSP